MKKRFYCIIGIVFIASIFYIDGKGNNYFVEKIIHYDFTLSNPTGTVVKDVVFKTYAPVPETSAQQVVTLIVSDEYTSETDVDDNHILRFDIARMVPYSTKIITIKVVLTMAEAPVKIPLNNGDRYLRREKFIEVTDPLIQKTAASLKVRNELATIKNIYRRTGAIITDNNIQPVTRGALYALNNGEGDCTEYTYLFTALCRAAGIPTRAVAGYSCPESKRLNPTTYHNRAEVFYDGAWRPVDAQNDIFFEGTADFVTMKILDNDVSDSFEKFFVAPDVVKVRMNQE